MLNVNGTTNVNAVQQTNTAQAQNLPFRGRTDYERAPEYDTYESGKKHSGLKTVGWLTGLTAVGLAIASFVKGKQKLPENSKLGDIMKEGWKEVKTGLKNLWSKVGGKNKVTKSNSNEVLTKKINEANNKEALEKLGERVKKYGSEETKKAYEEALKKFEEAAENAA